MAGRKSHYDPKYCKEVIEYLGKGHSVTAFAGHVGVARSVVFDWLKRYPEFDEAYQIAKGKSLGAWETKLIAIADGDSKGNPAAVIFGVKNRGSEDWRDVQSLEHTGKDGKPIKTQEVSSRDKLLNLVSRVAKREREDQINKGTTH
jgi:hypothetical protein